MKNNIAVVDLLKDIKSLLDDKKYNIIEFSNISQLKKIVKDCDVVIFDLKQRFDKGAVFKELKNINKQLKILGSTTFNKSRIAAKVLKFGLDDFFLFDKKNPNLINEKLEELLKKNSKIVDIPINILLNTDKKLKNKQEMLLKIANTNIPILIQGEYGCEQELYAKAIHNMSSKRDEKFMTVSCSFLTMENFKKILNNNKNNSGTVFFDEINSLDQTLQNYMIKFLEKVEELGLSNIRIIAGSNKNLTNEIKNGSFNETLFFMLNSYSINISPLREMRNIIPILVKNLYQYFALKENKSIDGISNRALKMLENYNWPGNIREIKTVVHRAVVLTQNKILDERDFFNLIADNNKKNTDNTCISLLNESGEFKNLDVLEREIIEKYMVICNSNISEIAKILDVGRATIYRKIQDKI